MAELIDPFVGAEPDNEAPPMATQPTTGAELNDPFEGADFKPREPKFFDFVTGADKNPENLDALSLSGAPIAKKVKIAGQSFFARDQFGKAGIIAENLPEATFDIDDNFNVIVDYKGKREFIDRPGFDFGDLTHFAGDVLKYAPSVKGGNILKGAAKTEGGKKLLGAVGVGTGAAATSVGSDLLGDAAGADQGVSGTQATLAGGGGALFEVLSPLIGRFINKALPKKDLYGFREVDGVKELYLTAKGEAIATKLGMNVNAMTERLAAAFDDAVKAGIDPANIKKVAENQAANIRISRGQATGDFPQLQMEDTARNANVSSSAGNRMRQFDKDQATDIVNATDDVQSNVAGNSEHINRPNQGGGIITERIKAAESSLASRVDEAYKAARETNASLSGESMLDMLKSIKASVKGEGVVNDLHPATASVIGDINTFIRISRTKGNTLKATDLAAIDKQRRVLQGRYNSAKNPEDQRLVGIMKRKMDEWLDDAIDNSLFAGDDNALALLKEARGLNTELRKKFYKGGKDDAAGRIIEKFVQTDVADVNAVNYLFGAGKLGGKQTSYAVIKKAEAIFGKNSEEMGILRQMAWQKVVGGSTLRDTVSAKNLVKSIDDALEGGGESVMTALFDAKQIAQIKVLRNAVNNTIVPGNVGNPSRTAHKLAVMLQQAMQALGVTAAVSTGGVGGASLAAGIVGAGKAINWAQVRNIAKPVTGTVSPPATVNSLLNVSGQRGGQNWIGSDGRTPLPSK